MMNFEDLHSLHPFLLPGNKLRGIGLLRVAIGQHAIETLSRGNPKKVGRDKCLPRAPLTTAYGDLHAVQPVQ